MSSSLESPFSDPPLPPESRQCTPERRYNFSNGVQCNRGGGRSMLGRLAHVCTPAGIRQGKLYPVRPLTLLTNATQGWPRLAKAGQGWTLLPNATLTYHQRYTRRKVVPRAAVDTSHQRYTHLSPTLQSQKSCTPCGRWHFSPTLHSLITNAILWGRS